MSEEISMNDMVSARLRSERYLEDKPAFHGYLIVKLNGEIVSEGPNLVTNVGKSMVIDRVGNVTPGAQSAIMSHMGIGSGATSPTVGDTALVTEVGTRVTLGHTTNVAGRSISATVTFPANNPSTTETIREMGIFNAASAGQCYARALVPNPPVKTPSDSLEIVYTLNIN